jgi:dUTP pyrophosphatase
MEIKIKRLHPEAKIPKYSKEGDAGMDVYAVSKQENDKYIQYGTGLAFEIPKGYVCLVFPRSSLSNKDLILANHVGVLDSGYRGELFFRFKKVGEEVYEIGDRIGQIIIIPYPEINFSEAEELSESERGSDGWGSTGD